MMGVQEDADSTDITDLSALSRVITDYPGSDITRDTFSYIYDDIGRLATRAPLVEAQAQVDLDSFTTKLQYAGESLVLLDEPRQSSTYTIEMGRIVSRTTTSKQSGEARTTRYTYDESDRLVQVTDGTFAFVLDCQPGPGAGDGDYSITWEDDRVVGIVSDAGDLSVGYGYDDAGLLISRSISRNCDNSEAVERYSRDEAGRLTTIERDPGSAGTLETEERSYNELGQLVGIALTNTEGVTEERSRHVYKAEGQLESSVTLVNGNVAQVMTFEYSSDLCVEQLWTEPEDAVVPESETRNVRAPGMPRCAYFPSLR